MPLGYAEFEFDLPTALLTRLVELFNKIEPVPLDEKHLDLVSKEQGVYQLFLKNAQCKEELVYIGKSDSKHGLQVRLRRHLRKIRSRTGLDVEDVKFKAVRVFVFTAVDLEKLMIKEYFGKKKPAWNNSGFGSNDPGTQRDTTKYKSNHFDAMYPIDLDKNLFFPISPNTSVENYISLLKENLDYLIRFETSEPVVSEKNRSEITVKFTHADFRESNISIYPDENFTTRNAIRSIIASLPKGWHATELPSHVIMYKNDTRKFKSGTLIARS